MNAFTDYDFVPLSARGEKCKCGNLAARKVEEVIFDDDPMPIRHPLTAYICFECFEKLMGTPLTMEIVNEAMKHVVETMTLDDLHQGLASQGQAYGEVQEDGRLIARKSPIVVGDKVVYVSATGKKWDAVMTAIAFPNPWHQGTDRPTISLEFRNERGKLVRKKAVLPREASPLKVQVYYPKEDLKDE